MKARTFWQVGNNAAPDRGRALFLQNAPHLVHDMQFVVPNYARWEAPFYGIGLKVYGLLAGRYGFGPSQVLSREETLERVPALSQAGLRGGVLDRDGQRAMAG